MKSKILNKIEKLRLQHTKAFQSERWLTMQTIREKIVKLWEIYHSL